MLIAKSFSRTFSRWAMAALSAGLLTLANITTPNPIRAQEDQPTSVTVAGTFQKALGCPDDWQPACDKTALVYDADDDLWSGTFDLAAGDYEFKAALNGSWDLNYGAKAEAGGANIVLTLAEPGKVRFLFDAKTGYITNDRLSIIANVPGSYQEEIGCPGDWQPDCLRSLLQDADGDGVYTFTTNTIPKGSYEAKVAVNEAWGENYGAKGVKDGPNIGFNVPFADIEVVFTWDSVTKVMAVDVVGAPKGNLLSAQAHWLTETTIAWPSEAVKADSKVVLTYAPDGGITLEQAGITGGQNVDLTRDSAGMSAALKQKYPHLADSAVFTVPAETAANARELLKGQVVISAVGVDGDLLDATSLQPAGVLDSLYSYNGSLGLTWNGDVPTIAVWSPTAKNVTLNVYDDSKSSTAGKPTPMQYDAASGVWSVTGDATWKNKYYAFAVELFVRKTGKFERNVVTDPYSLAVSANSQRSMIVDLDELTPQGWGDIQKPPLQNFEDVIVYELHVRDFSMSDTTVPEELRGTYKAFNLTDTNGVKHLSSLADAGLTHVHLLPAFDIASIPERRADQRTPSLERLLGYAPDSSQQQEYIAEFTGRDGFNWGYDPYHFNTPEGGYSTNPDDGTRVTEFREMVAGLNKIGLRAVMDVVYNHTSQAGQDPKSVLDKIVPDYYYRLNADGNIETSTCCQNTATEHAMMEKLMIDSVVLWAREYKVDGFRFDLMGHHMKQNMLNVRAALDALTLETDGVDGKKIFLYGEGWDFGEVGQNQRGINATQINMAGTGIATFNDRLRDGVRGGSPFSDPRVQGFATGLTLAPSGFNGQGTPEEQTAKLGLSIDWIKIGLAGNLKDYQFTDSTGATVTGGAVAYGGSPAGYNTDPQEHIVYVSAHDNETIWDKIQFAAAATDDVDTRIRMNTLALSVVMYAQGVPFFHAGDDILRSKSGDRNSYNAGDWFNRLDLSYQTNNWAVGLPPSGDNQDRYEFLTPLLANPALSVTPDQIQRSHQTFIDMLRIRKSSPLFRLTTAEQIQQKLSFVGNDEGTIVMVLDDTVGEDLDPNLSKIVVIFNAARDSQSIAVDGVTSGFSLNSIQAESEYVGDAAFTNGQFILPALTTAVFVAR